MLKGISRRGLIASTMLLAAFGVARAETIELKLSHYLPPNHTWHKVLEEWAQDIDKRSSGRLKVSIYPAAQLGPVQRQLDLARNGQADIAIGLIGATPGRYPMTELISLPFVFPKAGTGSAVTSQRLSELAPKYLQPEYPGLHILMFGVPPIVSFFTAKRDLSNIDNVKGLKIRFQGEQNAAMLRELGAAPLQVPPGEIADGMSKGVIDGALFNYEAAESFGLGSVTKHVLEPGITTGALAMVMNTRRYDSLPPDLKAIIDETTNPATAAALGKRWDEAEQHGRDYMKRNNVAIETLAPEQVAALKAKLEPQLASAVAAVEKSGKPAKQMLEEYQR